MTTTKTLAEALASRAVALLNCGASGNAVWADRHTTRIAELCELLPSGSGVDNGTKFDVEKSKHDCLRFTLDYHHMDDHGGYVTWTYHAITVRPSFIHGLAVTVTGSNRNDIRLYLAELFNEVLSQNVED